MIFHFVVAPVPISLFQDNDRVAYPFYEKFRSVYDERFSKRYGFWCHITDEVKKYLKCGDTHYGFAKIRCKDCGAEYLRAFDRAGLS